MMHETVTLKLPRKMLSDAGVVASAQDVTIGHLVRVLLAKEIERRLSPTSPLQLHEGLLTALQTLFSRDMAAATGWDDLAARLAFHGYELRPAHGDVMLFKSSCGTPVCDGSALGFGYESLVQRFGTGMPGFPKEVPRKEIADAPTPLNSTGKGRLQRSLEPVFKTSTDWEMLIMRLRRRGLVLRPMGTGSAIYSDPGGRHVCNTATVGYRYRALVRKFGAPMPGHPHGADWVKGACPQPEESEFSVFEDD